MMAAMGAFFRWLAHPAQGLREWPFQLGIAVVLAVVVWFAGLSWSLALAIGLGPAVGDVLVRYWQWKKEQRRLEKQPRT